MDTLSGFAHAVNGSVCRIDGMNTSYVALIVGCSKFIIHFHNASIDTTRHERTALTSFSNIGIIMWGNGRVQNEEYPKECGEVYDIDFMWVARIAGVALIGQS
jgi:hypothetical protein